MLSALLSPLQKIGLYALSVLLIFGAGYYKGFSNERDRFVAFKADLEAKAKAQEMINKATEQKNKLIADNIRNDYENKLFALRKYYSSVGVRHPDSTKLPPLSESTQRIIASSPDPVLAGQCAETTLMLVSLQNWVQAVNKE